MCARAGLQCVVYMGAKDMERQALNVFRMRLLGAEVQLLPLAARGRAAASVVDRRPLVPRPLPAVLLPDATIHRPQLCRPQALPDAVECYWCHGCCWCCQTLARPAHPGRNVPNAHPCPPAAQVRPVHSGTSTLKDATSEAIRDWVTNVESTHYILGSVAGPHPYPMMVRLLPALVVPAHMQRACACSPCPAPPPLLPLTPPSLEPLLPLLMSRSATSSPSLGGRCGGRRRSTGAACPTSLLPASVAAPTPWASSMSLWTSPACG